MSEVATLGLKRLSARHREFCRLVISGATGREIMERLGYCESRVSVLKSEPLIVAEIERLEDQLFENVGARLKSLVPTSLDVMERILLSDDPTINEHVRRKAAQWVLEKVR